MIDFIDLDVGTSTATKTLNWVTDALVVKNNTPYPLYVNWRSTKIPSIIAYDELVPGGMYTVIPAIGNNFGFKLETTSFVAATGQKCAITFQKDETIPSFSQSSFRSQLSIPFTLDNLNVSDNIDIPAAGALGISLNAQLLAVVGTDGMNVRLETSNDGMTWANAGRFQVFPPLSFSKIVPVTANFYRVIIDRMDGVGTITGIFTFALLDYYAEIPKRWRTFTISEAPQAVPIAWTIGSSPVFGTLNIKRVWCYFELPNPTDIFYVTLSGAGTLGGGSQFNRIAITNAPPRGGIDRQDVGIMTKNLAYRRRLGWGYSFDVDWFYTADFNLNFVNEGISVALSNVTWGYEGNSEV